MTEGDKIYYAGFVDGEGCISICRSHKQLYLSVNVTNSDKNSVQFLRDNYGGYLGLVKQRKSHHKPYWQWVVASNMAVVFLKDILPFLRIKKEQAELGIKFQEEIVNRLTGGKLSLGEIEIRESMFLEMKSLKAVA